MKMYQYILLQTLFVLIFATDQIFGVRPFEGKSLSEVFPLSIEMTSKSGDKILLSREIAIEGMHISPSMAYEFPEIPGDKISINDYYLTFKRHNNMNYFVEYDEISLFEGKAYINGQSISDPKADFPLPRSFVLNDRGTVLMHNGRSGNHAGIYGGQYVVCAGEVTFDENGKIAELTNRTGHYMSSDSQLQYAVKYFDSLELFAKDAVIRAFGCGANPMSVTNFLQLDFQMNEVATLKDVSQAYIPICDFPQMGPKSTIAYTTSPESSVRKSIEIISNYERLHFLESHGIAHYQCLRPGTTPENDPVLKSMIDELECLKRNNAFPEMRDRVIASYENAKHRAHM